MQLLFVNAVSLFMFFFPCCLLVSPISLGLFSKTETSDPETLPMFLSFEPKCAASFSSQSEETKRKLRITQAAVV